jgi:hypothetical protein
MNTLSLLSSSLGRRIGGSFAFTGVAIKPQGTQGKTHEDHKGLFVLREILVHTVVKFKITNSPGFEAARGISNIFNGNKTLSFP